MTDPARDLHSLMTWWRDAGVSSAEAEAILAAPVASPSARSKSPTSTAPPATPTLPRPLAKAQPQPVDAPARRIANAADSLDALESAARAYDGCALKQGAKSTVVFDGVKTAPILVIGEAPGRDEDLAGKPFVGRSGQLLDRMFAEIGLSRRSNILITNAIYWRPPGNRTPDVSELAHCLPFVERTIALAQPKAVFLIGGVAASALLGAKEGVLRLRGRTFIIENKAFTKPVNAMVMLHPAYLLRRPLDKRLAWADLIAAEAWLDSLGVQRTSPV